MAGLYELQFKLLADRKITRDEVSLIEEQIRRDGRLDLDDVKFLVQLLADADEVCPEFDELFFPALKEVLLADGKIGLDEQFYLLKMLYSDAHLRDSERQFLKELRDEAHAITPEFEQLYATAMAAPAKNWSVEGVAR
jgi:hypothetical protein